MFKRIIAAAIVGVFAFAATPVLACGGSKSKQTTKKDKTDKNKKTVTKKKGAKQV